MYRAIRVCVRASVCMCVCTCVCVCVCVMKNIQALYSFSLAYSLAELEPAVYMQLTGADLGGGEGGAPGARAPPFRSSNYIFMLRNRTV